MNSYKRIAPYFFGLALGFGSPLAYAQGEKPITDVYSLPDFKTYDAYYDVKYGLYYIYPKVGDIIVGTPTTMSPSEYRDFLERERMAAYYRDKSNLYSLSYRKNKTAQERRRLVPAFNIRNRLFESIFGGNKIELIPQGSASFDLAGLYQKIDNPLVLPQNRTNFNFDIDQRIQLGITGKVGENLVLKANYDTQSGFAFENRMNLAWQAKGSWQDLVNNGLNTGSGGEDKIIKKIELGNVNMPLSTSLIQGSESLFGIKTDFQLGKTFGTVVLSQQQGEARNITVQGGGLMTPFKINAIDYEENQHYYLSQYFLNTYDTALQNYPFINSKININRIEAWVIDQGASNLQSQKSIVGIRDLGEAGASLPDNNQNNVYQSVIGLGAGLRDPNTSYSTINGQNLPTVNGTETYQDGENFIFNKRARKLNSNEFIYDNRLGYLSLNQKLNDNQLLAVSFTYTINGNNKVFKVGEFSEEGEVLVTKLIKPNSTIKTSSPMWDLMMKNIYSLESYQVSPEKFTLNIMYRDPSTGGKLTYLPDTPVKDKTLLQVMNWDRLNLNGDLEQNNGATGDGLFDYVPNLTIRPQDGKLIFTKAKPFGKHLETVLGSNDPKYVFNDLYSKQKQVASQNNLAQRYTIEGRYQGSQGNGIPLNAINIPKGSVKVTANGMQLVEGQDYTVDYLLGRVNIINETVRQSGQAINISLENQLTFNTQRKSFIGLNLEHRFRDNFILGGTVVNYSETPLTQKVNYGNEAVNNTMAGFNILYSGNAPYLTRFTDKIPLINTEAPSTINLRAEGAYLIPGLNKRINGLSYIDDFETTTSKISLKEPTSWTLSSNPEKTNNPVFSNASAYNSLNYGDKRSLMSWYFIDPRFWGVGGQTPTGISSNSVSNHASRRVNFNEIYTNRDFVAGEQQFLNTLDISFYPSKRGPYNVSLSQAPPSQSWAGMMRPLSVTNFINNNIEYVEFWMMDPYADGVTLGPNPKMLLHLGNVSEDVLKDGKLQFENGLPTPASPATTTSTVWGIQPSQTPILYAFSSEGEDRKVQDAGLDGINNQQEQERYPTGFINPVSGLADPAADDFLFYLSNKFQGTQASSVVERYSYFRNPEGNSISNSIEVASQTPDAEDANGDYNLDLVENYNQYTIDLAKNKLQLGQNNIVDEKEVEVTFQNGQKGKNKWFLFRIPVNAYDTDAGTHDNSVLNNVRYARLLMTGFDQTSTIRLASLDLIRSDWRRYTNTIFSQNVPANLEGTATAAQATDLEIGSVNLEENAANQPPYVLPPGIDRQVLSGNAGAQRQNEYSLYLKAKNLGAEARGVFKNINIDLRRFQKLKLFVHSENLDQTTDSGIDQNLKFFIRLGSDNTDNYYEYEYPLKYTSKNSISPSDIWPAENMMDIDVQKLVDAKILRDKTSPNTITGRFEVVENPTFNKKIFVKGRPSIGNITTIMMGVRNDLARSPKNVVLWINELRSSDIKNEGGYAGNASLNFNLGDFAVVNASAAHSSVGFGNITQRPSERAQASNTAFSVNANINADKFLPEKAGIKIPVTYSYSQAMEDPKYNPLDNDVEFKNAPNKEELKKVARTYSQQRTIGVVNLHKERTNSNQKPKFYDPENISITAVYNDDYYRDIYTTKNYRQNLRGFIDYNYSLKPWVISPFKKLIPENNSTTQYLKWLRDFNINFIPNRISFRADVDRNYSELQFRNIDALLSGDGNSSLNLIQNRNFFFGWQYGLGFNLTKSLKLEVNSAMKTLNDELSVRDMNTNSIFANPFRAGRPVLYNHRAQLNYRVPFQLFPYLDFINAELGYGFTYNWNTRSTALLGSPDGSLGSIGQNTNTKNATLSINFPKLWGNFNYFKKLTTTQQKRRQEIDSLNNVYAKAWERKRFRYKPYRFKNRLTVGQILAGAATSLKQIDLNFNENNGTVIPGLLSAPNWYGYGQTLGGPTAGFLMGSQADIRRELLERGWITGSQYLVDPYLQTTQRNLQSNIQIVPITDLRIDANVLHSYSRNFTQSGYNVDANPLTAAFDASFGNDFVTYSNSTFTAKTFNFSGTSILTEIYKNAQAISASAGTPQGNTGYADGYGLSNSYVLIPAFRAAVEGKTATGLLDRPKRAGFPLPNWRVTYSGLKNIPIVNSYFSKFDIQHGYTSTYTSTGIQSNISYYDNPGGKDLNGNFLNPYIVSQVGYVETFSPLLGIDFTLRNNIQVRAQYNKDRSYILGLVNSTLTEDSGTEYLVGVGYILKDLRMRVNFRRGGRNLKSDMNIRGDLAIRDNVTRITNLLYKDSQITGGQRLFSLRLSAEYNLTENLNFRAFYDQLMSKYKISTAFPLSTIRAGITATFTFGNEEGFR